VVMEAQENKKTIIYGTEWCPACKEAKKYYEEQKIPFEYKIVGQDITIEEFKEKTNSMSVPVIEKPNGEMTIGFKP